MEEEGEGEDRKKEELILSVCFAINPDSVPTHGA